MQLSKNVFRKINFLEPIKFQILLFFPIKYQGKNRGYKIYYLSNTIKKIMLITINTDEAERHKVEVTKFSSTGNFNIF